MDTGNKRKKLILICSFALFASLLVKGQTFSCASSSSTKQIEQYNKDFLKILSTNLHEEYVVRFVALPSFSPEYAFQIIKMNDGVFKIETIIFQDNLWYISCRDSVHFQIYNKDINEEFVQRLDVLFRILTDIEDRMIHITMEDGDYFNFFRKSTNEVRCSQIADSEESSPWGKVIVLCNNLVKYASGELTELDSIQVLNIIIDELISLKE